MKRKRHSPEEIIRKLRQADAGCLHFGTQRRLDGGLDAARKLGLRARDDLAAELLDIQRGGVVGRP